jgi:hypothetical protein
MGAGSRSTGGRGGGGATYKTGYTTAPCAHCVFARFACFSLQTATVSLNSVNRLIFVTVKCGVSFAVQTEFLNILFWTSFGIKRTSSNTLCRNKTTHPTEIKAAVSCQLLLAGYCGTCGPADCYQQHTCARTGHVSFHVT